MNFLLEPCNTLMLQGGVAPLITVLSAARRSDWRDILHDLANEYAATRAYDT